MLSALFREHVTSASPAQDQVFHYTLTEVPTTTLLNPEAGFRDFCIAVSIWLRACMFGCDVRTPEGDVRLPLPSHSLIY